MLPHVADGHIMHGAWVPIMLHMGSALQGHEGARRRFFFCCCFVDVFILFLGSGWAAGNEAAPESLIAGR